MSPPAGGVSLGCAPAGKRLRGGGLPGGKEGLVRDGVFGRGSRGRRVFQRGVGREGGV